MPEREEYRLYSAKHIDFLHAWQRVKTDLPPEPILFNFPIRKVYSGTLKLEAEFFFWWDFNLPDSFPNQDSRKTLSVNFKPVAVLFRYFARLEPLTFDL